LDETAENAKDTEGGSGRVTTRICLLLCALCVLCGFFPQWLIETVDGTDKLPPCRALPR